jgi:hypothetical protein
MFAKIGQTNIEDNGHFYDAVHVFAGAADANDDEIDPVEVVYVEVSGAQAAYDAALAKAGYTDVTWLDSGL